jgi:hypothetical protein
MQFFPKASRPGKNLAAIALRKTYRATESVRQLRYGGMIVQSSNNVTTCPAALAAKYKRRLLPNPESKLTIRVHFGFLPPLTRNRTANKTNQNDQQVSSAE